MPIKQAVEPIATSRTLWQVFIWSLLVGVYSIVAVLKEHSQYATWGDVPSGIHAALSLVVGLLLVFRTNSAYSRWWEARTLWGGLVNACRNLAVKTHYFANLAPEQAATFRQLIISFPVALKHHLRDENDAIPKEIQRLAQHAKHVPLGIVNQLYALVKKVHSEGHLDSGSLWILDAELHRLMDICGGCERIKKTRIVRSYRSFARQITTLVLLTLPWGMVEDFGVWTIPLTTISAYFMIGLEVVAEHVEEPFGYDEDDLDLDALCTTIEATVSESFPLAG